jgi:hypothetical protein
MKTIEVEVPFEGDQPLELDPYTRGDTYEDAVTHLRWLLDTMDEDGTSKYSAEDALDRVLKATVALRAAGAGTLPECLRTAIVWERG